MQIISGEYRGRKLKLSADARPTQNLARGAIFNMLDGILPVDGRKIHVWDAFAGSGALGLEILSRYKNSTAVFTDISDISVRAITDNLHGVDFARYKVDKSDAVIHIRKYAPRVNLVFVDPPYSEPNLGIDFVNKLADAGFHGIIVQEIESNQEYTPDTNRWNVLRDKKYGRARLLIMQRDKGFDKNAPLPITGPNTAQNIIYVDS